MALEPRMDGEITKVMSAGDVALVMNRWQLEGTRPDGARVEMGGHSADVMRRAPDGGWRILIDDLGVAAFERRLVSFCVPVVDGSSTRAG